MISDQKILVVQVHYSTPNLLINSLQSLEVERLDFPQLQVIVVDNCSPDNSADEIESQIIKRNWGEWVSLIRSELNGGYAYGNNLAVKRCIARDPNTQLLWLLNPCLLYTSPSPRDQRGSRMPSSA